jgi:hypothetical protein
MGSLERKFKVVDEGQEDLAPNSTLELQIKKILLYFQNASIKRFKFLRSVRIVKCTETLSEYGKYNGTCACSGTVTGTGRRYLSNILACCALKIKMLTVS